MARIETRRRTAGESMSHTVGAGIGAGIVAALVMILFGMIVFAARELGFFRPLQLIGALFMGGDALVYTFWSALLGLGIHMVVGATFGVIFAAMARRMDSYGMRLAAGLAYGAIIFLVMTYLVLPWANPLMAVAIDPGWFFLAHLAFGFTLGALMPRRAVRTYREEAYSRP